ncbi:uncharacterized protein LOC112560161 [Pomacea canaliculata]|uniref:uncharacterized protein LOC112560161 n=1 Tax=Pomacea canaliculata TaxID=400727 RepID=UPI000D72EA65|nr:uncharacterized protein LOC112560161 [Pomacea canaliculata]
MEMQGDSVQNCFPIPGLYCFSGPDGIANDRVHLLKDSSPIYTGPYTPERTFDVEYIWRPAPGTPFHRPRATFSGEVGWHSWFFLDTEPFKTGHQVHLAEFRRQVEERCTNLYQPVWKPKRGANILKSSYGPKAQNKSKAKDQSPAFENKASQQTTPRSAVISPLFNSAASPASGFSSKSRASHKKSDEAATPRSVHATTPQPISSNDQNVNRGVSGLLETLQGIDDPSSNVGLVSVEALPCISRTSHLSFSSAGSRRSQGSQPILPRSQASSIADYYPVRVPRRLNSALELGRKESSGNRVTRSQSVDQKRYK